MLDFDEADALWALLSQARSAGRFVLPSEVLIAGFEDHKPIPVEECYVPPSLMGTSLNLPGNLSSSAGGNFDVEKIIELIKKLETNEHPIALIIRTNTGIGKTTLFKYLYSKLQEHDLKAMRWIPGVEAPVILCDDLDLLESSQKLALFEAIHEQRSILLASSTEELIEERMPQYHAVWNLGLNPMRDVSSYLEMLARIAKKYWSISLDIDSLLANLVEDPFLLQQSTHPELLGFFARTYCGGQIWKLSELPRRTIEATIRRLDIIYVDKKWILTVLETVGVDILRGLALVAFEQDSDIFETQQLVEIIGKLNNIYFLGTGGIFEVLEAMIAAGILRKRGNKCRVAYHSVLTAALGLELADNEKLIEKYLTRFILDTKWHESIVVFAQTQNDCTDLLRLIWNQKLSIKSHSFQLVTRVFAAGVAFSDINLVRRIFGACVAWWRCWKSPHDGLKMIMTLSPQSLTREPIREDRINGLHPLIALSLAVRLQPSLVGDEKSEKPSMAKSNEKTVDILSLMGKNTIFEDKFIDAIIAPTHHLHLIADTQFWQQLKSESVPFDRGDIDEWWFFVVAPSLRDCGKTLGLQVLAGCKNPELISEWLYRPSIGINLWYDALLSRLNDYDVSAPLAWTQSALFASEYGGNIIQSRVKELWNQAPDKTSLNNLSEKFLREISLKNFGRGFREEFDTWLLERLEKQQLLDLWDYWEQNHICNLPWLCAFQVGLSFKKIISWACKRLISDSQDQEAHDVVNVVLQAEDPECLEIVFRHLDWARLDMWKLIKQYESTAIKARLRLACDLLDYRRRLVHNILPRSNEHDLWKNLYDYSDSHIEALLRKVQLTLSAPHPDWNGVINSIKAINLDKLSNLKHVNEDLAELGVTLEAAQSRDFSSLDPVLKALAKSSVIQSFLGGYDHSKLWAILMSVLEISRLYDIVIGEDYKNLVSEELLFARLQAFLYFHGGEEIFIYAIQDKLRAHIAVRVLDRIRQERGDIFQKLLEELPFEQAVREGPNKAVVAGQLLTGFAKRSPDQVVGWLKNYINGIDNKIARQWWYLLIPVLPSGLPRAEVFDAAGFA